MPMLPQAFIALLFIMNGLNPVQAFFSHDHQLSVARIRHQTRRWSLLGRTSRERKVALEQSMEQKRSSGFFDRPVSQEDNTASSSLQALLNATRFAASRGIAKYGIGSSSDRTQDRNASEANTAAIEAVCAECNRLSSAVAVMSGTLLEYLSASPIALTVPLWSYELDSSFAQRANVESDQGSTSGQGGSRTTKTPIVAQISLTFLPEGTVADLTPTQPGALLVYKALRGCAFVATRVGQPPEKDREIGRRVLASSDPAWQALGGAARQLSWAAASAPASAESSPRSPPSTPETVPGGDSAAATSVVLQVALLPATRDFHRDPAYPLTVPALSVPPRASLFTSSPQATSGDDDVEHGGGVPAATTPAGDSDLDLAAWLCSPRSNFQDFLAQRRPIPESNAASSLSSSSLPSALSPTSTFRGAANNNSSNLSPLFVKPEALDAVGGLDEELAAIARRVLGSRRLPPDQARVLGISHVRGMLLYGPPGCGKTLVARSLAEALGAVDVQVVSGPEVLNKFVGTSEERVRELFCNAEAAHAALGPSAGLHVVVLDELDSLCRARGSLAGDTSGVRDSVVNQLLAKIDGVESCGNVLVVGMTNRKDLIDDAMLRPGRLELHVRVGRPKVASARRQILDIHTRELRAGGRLGDCNNGGGGGVEGRGGLAAADAALDEIAEATEGCSGAELAGIVRLASSFALERYFHAIDGNDSHRQGPPFGLQRVDEEKGEATAVPFSLSSSSSSSSSSSAHEEGGEVAQAVVELCVRASDLRRALAEAVAEGPDWAARSRREAAVEEAAGAQQRSRRENPSPGSGGGSGNAEGSGQSWQAGSALAVEIEAGRVALESFLDRIGLGCYAGLFSEQEVGAEELLAMGGGGRRVAWGQAATLAASPTAAGVADAQLRELGIEVMGHRLRILSRRSELADALAASA